MFNETHVLHTTLILTISLSLASMFWRLSVSLGILLGGLISTLALKILIIDGTKMLQSSKEGRIDSRQAKKYSWRSFIKRCSLYAAALIIAIRKPYLSFFATFGGLLLPRVAIIYHLLRGRINRGT